MPTSTHEFTGTGHHNRAIVLALIQTQLAAATGYLSGTKQSGPFHRNASDSIETLMAATLQYVQAQLRIELTGRMRLFVFAHQMPGQPD